MYSLQGKRISISLGSFNCICFTTATSDLSSSNPTSPSLPYHASSPQQLSYSSSPQLAYPSSPQLTSPQPQQTITSPSFPLSQVQIQPQQVFTTSSNNNNNTTVASPQYSQIGQAFVQSYMSEFQWANRPKIHYFFVRNSTELMCIGQQCHHGVWTRSGARKC